MAATKSASTAKKKPAAKTAASKSTASKMAAKPKASAKAAAPKKAAPASRAAPAGLQSVKRFDGKTAKEPMAMAFLMQQHREVEGWFEQYEKANSDEQKAELSAKICNALKVHAQIEEELLYPPAHEQLEDEDMVDEAYVEHASAKDLIRQIEGMKVGEHLYDAKVKVLGEYIKHHVEEEENELFPEIKKKMDLDLQALGEQLKARADQLMAGQGKASKRKTSVAEAMLQVPI